MTDDEILDLADAWSFLDYGRLSFTDVSLIQFARCIQASTLTKQKARWYQEGLEAGLRQALAESPNFPTDVVESETEEPLTLGEKQEAQQQLETHLDAIYQRNNQAFLAQARLGQIEIKRLQELTDYRLMLLTKMPSTEPIGEIVQAFGDLTAVSIPTMPAAGTKLYASPPQREWVGLTVEELTEIVDFYISVYGHIDLPHSFARSIEAKLKEKNA